MDDRLYLHSLLESTFPELEVYYRPGNFPLTYPCIVYEKVTHESIHAANSPYVTGTTYQATILALTPGFNDTKRMLQIPGTRHSREFILNDVVHDVYEIRVNSA